MLESNEIFFVNANPVSHVWEIYTLLYLSRKTLYSLELQFTKEVNFLKLSACKPQIKKFQFHKCHRLLIDFLVYAWSSNTCLLHSWTVFPLWCFILWFRLCYRCRAVGWSVCNFLSFVLSYKKLKRQTDQCYNSMLQLSFI